MLEASGESVPGATVVVWPRSVARWAEDYQPPSGVTRDDGRFRVDGIPDGAASLIVESPGGPLLAIRGRETPCPPVAGREATDLGDFRLPRTADLAGRVVDGDGDPVPAVTVELPGSASGLVWLPVRYWEGSRATVETGADGRFRIPGLAVGSRIAMRLRAEGYVPRFLERGGVSPDGTDLPDLVLEGAGAIRVRVVDERTGQPVPEAGVSSDRVGVEEAWGPALASPQTDDTGVVLLRDLAPGSYRIRAWGRGLSLLKEARAEVRPAQTAEVTVIVASAPGIDVEVSLRGGGIPLEGAEIVLSRLRGEPDYNEDEVLEGGAESVVFRDVPFGRYQLRASHTALPHLPRREVDVAPGTHRFELAFEAPEGGWVPVFGRVMDERGQPVPGARVYFSTPTGGASYEVIADASGRFAVEAVAAGRYTGEADAQGTGLRMAQLDFEARPPRTGGLVFALRRGIDVEGTVLGLLPAQRTSVVVRAGSESPHSVYESADGFVEPDGTYHLEGVTAGTWAIEAIYEGLGANATLTVPEGAERMTGPDLVFAEGHTVSGTLLYQGEPYAGVRVSLRTEEATFSVGRGVAVTTGTGGQFAFDPVSAGTYRLSVSDPEWGLVHNEILEVTGDLQRTFALGAARVSGQVLDAETGLPVPEAQVDFYQADATYIVTHSMPSSADLEEEARFEIGPLEGGRWSLKAVAEGYVPEVVVIEVRGEDREGVVISVTPTPGLDLVVRTALGAVPDAVSLRFECPETSCTVAETTLHPAGLAENRWPDAPPGQWRLLAWDSTGACVRVAAAVPGPEVEVILPALARLEVRVPDLEGEQSDAILRLFDEQGGLAANRGCSDPGCTDWPIRANRRFYAFGLQPGVYEARVTAADGRTWTGSARVEPGLGNAVTLR